MCNLLGLAVSNTFPWRCLTTRTTLEFLSHMVAIRLLFLHLRSVFLKKKKKIEKKKIHP